MSLIFNVHIFTPVLHFISSTFFICHYLLILSCPSLSTDACLLPILPVYLFSPGSLLSSLPLHSFLLFFSLPSRLFRNIPFSSYFFCLCFFFHRLIASLPRLPPFIFPSLYLRLYAQCSFPPTFHFLPPLHSLHTLLPFLTPSPSQPTLPSPATFPTLPPFLLPPLRSTHRPSKHECIPTPTPAHTRGCGRHPD